MRRCSETNGKNKGKSQDLRGISFALIERYLLMLNISNSRWRLGERYFRELRGSYTYHFLIRAILTEHVSRRAFHADIKGRISEPEPGISLHLNIRIRI